MYNKILLLIIIRQNYIYLILLTKLLKGCLIIIIKHSLGKQKLKAEGKPKFMLTSNGAFYYNNPNSKYRGLYYPVEKHKNNWALFKTIDFIRLDSEITEIENKFDYIKLKTKKGKIKFSFNKGVLLLDTDYNGEITFSLDMREMYDFDDKGRIYHINKEKNNIIVEYHKHHNNLLENVHYSNYLIVNTKFKHKVTNEWRLEAYVEDRERKSYPYELYVYDAFKLKCKGKDKIKIVFSDDKNIALKKIKSKLSPKKFETSSNDLAYNCALKSVNDLYIDLNNFQGYYAGLPWFYQIWTRDEAISLKALIIEKKYDLVKSILLNRIRHLNQSGRIPNRMPHSNLETADGTGWVFLRLYELLKQVEDIQEQYFSPKDLSFIRKQLHNSIKSTETQELLVYNKALETWMDTSNDNDTREGYRIEIQALWLSMLRFVNYLDELLGRKQQHSKREKDTVDKVKEMFFNGEILKDGSDDQTIRSYIFLAYYIYPELLTKKQWETVFDKAIPRLWLSWGGFSTIDITSQLFCDHYTGEDNKSYHRGDSWFYINNIAAICLVKLNKKKYKKYIDKIIKASTQDILFNGIIGRPSELSSASELKAQASLFQLWSAASFVELCNE